MSDKNEHIIRRKKISKFVNKAKRIGYIFLLISCISFTIAATTHYNKIAVYISTVSIITACIILPVPIVLGYGIKAAQREDIR